MKRGKDRSNKTEYGLSELVEKAIESWIVEQVNAR
jgi:hypothetical protein